MSDQDWRYQQRWVKQNEQVVVLKRAPNLYAWFIHTSDARLRACGTKTSRKAAMEAADLFWRCQ